MSALFLFSCIFSCCCLIAEPMPIRVARQANVPVTSRASIDVDGNTKLEGSVQFVDRSQQLATNATNYSIMLQEKQEPKTREVLAGGVPVQMASSVDEIPHEVEHLPILKNERFWILMGAIIVCIAGIVVKVEVGSSSDGQAGESGEKEADKDPSDSDDEEVSTRNYYLQFALTIAALYVAMLLWGVAQEYVMSQPYISADGTVEKVPSSLSLVLWNRVIAVVFLGSILKLAKKPLYFPGFHMGALPAITNSLASWCQYDSLNYITFALQVTVKSTKLLPVVLISSLRGKRMTIFDYMEAFVLMMALIVFGVETESEDENSSMPIQKVHGMLLLVGLVCFDAMTPHLQDIFFKSYKDLDSMSAQFSMSLFAAVGIFLWQLCNGTLFQMARFVHRHPDCLLHMTVLGLSSAITQYLITYTIKHYGPVSFTVITSVRQVVAVFVSDTLFGHQLTALAITAMIIVFVTVMSRAVRQFSKHSGTPRLLRDDGDRTLLAMVRQDSSITETMHTILARLAHADGYSSLVTCTVSLHLCFCFYAIAQEFLATHTFSGEIFTFPMFLVAGNHTVAFLFASIALKSQDIPILVKDMRWTSIPACTNLVGSYLQHAALYQIYFPAQTLMKSLKIIPVMIVGRLMKNRTYTILDYVEAFVITGLVCFFVYDFELSPGIAQLSLENANDVELPGESLEETPSLRNHNIHVYTGIVMMLGYLIMDASTVNTEDVIYQQTKIDPGQMLVGMEVISGTIAWVTMASSGELAAAIHFMHRNGDMLFYFSLFGLALSSAVGAYTCVLTVRLFGPVVLALLMLCRQILSLVASVIMFQHKVNWQSCLCLVVVCNLVLLASIRRVTAQLTSRSEDDEAKSPKAPMIRQES
mmetsp:Transcript_150081/g.279728  ORF Transcript_150081/g.279728 Transcript_150081/m.279728 type:complete len:871 (-) Transcript_150081:101-2713(-)